MNGTESLPRDDTAERFYLGCFFQYPERAGELFALGVSDTDFFDPFHQKLHKAIREQHQHGGINIELLRARLKPTTSASDLSRDYIDELASLVTTTAYAYVETGKIIECRRKRDRLEQIESWAHQYRNGHATEDIDKDLFATANDWLRERGNDQPRFRMYSAAELDAATFETTYYIDNILVANEPCALGGAEKSLKTTVMLAMGIALNLPEHFLGMFPVAESKRFLMFSGESSMATIQETTRRMCYRAGCELGDLEGFTISPDLPRLDDAGDVLEFEAIIADHGPDVVAVDPMMLCLGDIDEKAANMFSMGKLLRRLNEACLRNGATLILRTTPAGHRSMGPRRNFPGLPTAASNSLCGNGCC